MGDESEREGGGFGLDVWVGEISRVLGFFCVFLAKRRPARRIGIMAMSSGSGVLLTAQNSRSISHGSGWTG